MMDYQAQIDAVIRRIREMEQSTAYHTQGIANSQTSIAQYQAAGLSASNLERITAHNAAINDHRANILTNEQELKELRKDLERLRTEADRYAAALAQAASEGLTGEAGAARAAALIDESKTKKTLYIIAGVGALIVVVASIIWFMRSRRASIPAAA